MFRIKESASRSIRFSAEPDPSQVSEPIYGSGEAAEARHAPECAGSRQEFWPLARGKGARPVSPFEAIKPIGQRSRGKEQLTNDETKRWSDTALRDAIGGSDGALAAYMTLVLGMRAGEVVVRTVRDVDDGGTRLRIRKAKTRKGDRDVKLPPVLQSLSRGAAWAESPTICYSRPRMRTATKCRTLLDGSATTCAGFVGWLVYRSSVRTACAANMPIYQSALGCPRTWWPIRSGMSPP